MSVVVANTLLSNEVLRLHPVERIINSALVTSPAKMLAFLAIARSDDPITATELKYNLNKAQGIDQQDEVGREWVGTEALLNYCLTGLEPAELIRVTQKKGVYRPVVAFDATDFGRQWAEPIFGAFLDLVLRSDFSTNRTFGDASSPADKNGIRASLVRLRILTHLHQKLGQPVNITALSRAINTPFGTASHLTGELEGDGMVRIMYKSNPADRTLGFLRPDLQRVNLYRSRMLPEIAAIYDTVAALYEGGARTMNGDAFLDEVEYFLPGLNRAAAWKSIGGNALSCIRFADEARFGRNKGKDAPRQRIELTPDSEPVVSELISAIRALKTSHTYRLMAAAQARRTIEDKAVVSYLMGRSRLCMKLTESAAVEVSERMTRLATRIAGWIDLQQVLAINASDWRKDAACQTKDPELFFGLGDMLTETEAKKARPICEGCISRLACLKWAMEQPERHGMWGGKTETERKNLPQDMLALLKTGYHIR